MPKITMDGAIMRNKLRGKLAKEIAEMPLSPGTEISELDKLILRAREIEKTAAPGEIL